jgi:hypothetical protein
MPIERFSKSQFEDALPKDHWYELGFVQNEWTYRVPIIPEAVEIEIRSSVDQSGYSADTGQDSIRCWLVNGNDKPLGSKVSKYTTRLPGWDKRMLGILRKLWEMAQWAGYCPDCKVPMGVFKVKANTKNKGKLFRKCRECKGHFEFKEE